MSDKELTELLRRKPQQGLAEVVRVYSLYVYKIVYTRLEGLCVSEDMEEAVSDIFLKFFRGGRDCGFEIESVRAYISAIAVRHCIDLMRSKLGKERDIPLSEVENTLIAEDICADDRRELIGAVKSLGEPDSSIFIRKYYFGQRSADIARDLGMKENTVNKRLSRGLLKLRKILEEGMK